MWLLEAHLAVAGIAAQEDVLVFIPNRKGGYALMNYSLAQMCNLWASLIIACIGGLLARLLDGRHSAAG
jgi:hypothetical protein